MSDQGILGVFASHTFLGCLSERHRMLLVSGTRPFTAEPNALLAREGETAKTFYLIQTGQVALGLHAPNHSVVPIQTVGPGDIIGWSWLVPPHRWRFDARTLDAVQGLAFDAEWLRGQCEQDHELGYHLLKQLVTVIANRLAATRRQLLKN